MTILLESGPRGYKTFYMLNSARLKFVLLINLKLLTIENSFLLNFAEHENFSANKYEIVGVFIFISRENFTLSWVEHEKSFITLGPNHQVFLPFEIGDFFTSNMLSPWRNFLKIKINFVCFCLIFSRKGTIVQSSPCLSIQICKWWCYL